MADITQVAHNEDDVSQCTTVSTSSLPVQGLQEAAAPLPGPTMRIKNLDTGEEYDLAEYDTRASSINGQQGPAAIPDQAGVLDDDEDPGNRELGGKRKAWLKGTKKLKTWAKTTLTNVKEKIEERIEKQQQQRQLQQQQLQQQFQQQLQQQQELQQPQSDSSRYSGSFGGWGRGHELYGQQPDGAPRVSRVPPLELPGPLQFGATEAGADDGAAAELGRGALDEGRGTSIDLSAASAPTGLTTPQYPGKAPALGTRAGGGPGAAFDSSSVLADSTYSVSSRGDSGFGLPGPSSSAGPVGVPTGLEATRGSAAAAKASGGGPAPRQLVPPLPPLRGLTSQPLGAGAAAGTAPTATAGAQGAPLSPFIVAGQADDGVQALYAEELRTPLLEEDVAGPSSRAVPTSKSWLNQTARVIGGRRAAGRQLQQVRMVQELFGHDGPVWAMKFSADARLLATAGRDGVLRVWSVYWYGSRRSKLIAPARDEVAPAPPSLSGPASLPASAAAGGTPGAGGAGPRPPLLSESPLLFLPGHRSDVLDLSWSQCRLLLTASADQTARLWCIDVPMGGGGGSAGGTGAGRRGSGSGHEGSGGEGGAVPPSGECLRSFVHPDFVTSCCFHPTNPRCIVTGCADGKVRVWSVPDASVIATATVQQDIITRALFSADGGRVVVGTLRGKVRHYEFTGGELDYLTQLDVKNPHGSGRKVTGLAQVPYTYGNDQLYVITSADSRIRLYVGYTQERKFKGHRHTNTQIAASLSPSCQHLVCGSDDGWVYVWETGLPPPPLPSTTPGSSLTGPGTGNAGAAAVGSAGDSGPGGSLTARSRAAAGGVVGAARDTAATVLRGAGKVKEGTYEAFHTPEQTTTVAIMAPNVCRLGRGLERWGLAPVTGGAQQHVAGAAAQLSLIGALFIVAGFSGKIYVYENLPAQGLS